MRYRAMAFLMVGIAGLFAGCETKGPAEKAGEKIDRAGEKVRDTFDPAGPGEKAGRAVDRATKP